MKQRIFEMAILSATARVKEWRKNNPDKVKEQIKRYYWKHKEELRKKKKKWLKKNPNYWSNWRKNNPERDKIYKKRWEEKNPNWRKEYERRWDSENRELKNKRLREWRHKKGITKKTMKEWTNGRTPEENRKMGRQRYYARRTNAGKLSSRILQMVYEDNIKKYGTLTCYLCVKPIEFGKDSLDHKIPLIRGGNNQYSNLGVACRSCNCKKHTKTENEYRLSIKEVV